jgi:hypothetical protein
LKSTPVCSGTKKAPAPEEEEARQEALGSRARHSRAEKNRVLCIVHYLLNKTGFLFLTALWGVIGDTTAPLAHSKK